MKMKLNRERIGLLLVAVASFLFGVVFVLLSRDFQAQYYIGREGAWAEELALDTLEKLASNNFTGAEDRLAGFVAYQYKDMISPKQCWIPRKLRQQQYAVQRIEQKAAHLPKLQQAIKQEQQIRVTNTASHGTGYARP